MFHNPSLRHYAGALGVIAMHRMTWCGPRALAGRAQAAAEIDPARRADVPVDAEPPRQSNRADFAPPRGALAASLLGPDGRPMAHVLRDPDLLRLVLGVQDRLAPRTAE